MSLFCDSVCLFIVYFVFWSCKLENSNVIELRLGVNMSSLEHVNNVIEFRVRVIMRVKCLFCLFVCLFILFLNNCKFERNITL